MNRIGWGFFLILTFVTTLPLSWIALSKVDFAYPYLHDAINIASHIDRYAPRNRESKLNFEKTTKEERVELFHGVVQSIESHGEGLETLKYTDKVTNKPVKLFTKAEVVHLQDVANLIDFLKILVISFLVAWLIIVAILKYRLIKIPRTQQLLFSTVLILILSGGILLIGPEAIFNQLHIWIFPENHQWFFYYEESLMSTMMKAPDLFAYIAGMLAFSSIILTAITLKVLKRLL